MLENNEVPKLKRGQDRSKITLYFDREIDRLYRLGKQNGWDVSEIVRRAASEALLKKEQLLASKADI